MKKTKPVANVVAIPAASPVPDPWEAYKQGFQDGLAKMAVTRSMDQTPSASHADLTMSITEAVNEFLIHKAGGIVSDRTLRQYTVVLKSFVKGRARKPLNAITHRDVESWLDNDDWSTVTRRHYINDLRTFFTYTVKKGWMEPLRMQQVTWMELPRGEDAMRPVEIHTPDEVRIVLEKAYEINPDAGRMLAIRYFAGVRAAEAHRMEETHIRPNGWIEIPAAIAKTRRRRLVKIQPCLAAWLALGGVLRPMSDMTLRAVIRRSKVKWKKNAPRHSFVTYHLAMWENAGQTALQAGHSEQMLFTHYREIATKEDAEKFWAVFPSEPLAQSIAVLAASGRLPSAEASALPGP